MKLIHKMLVGVFFVATLAIGFYILPWLARQVRRIARLDELEFSFFIIVALIFANLAELLGMHFILGAFIAGLFFGRRTIDSQVYDDVKGRVSGITTGFLAPIFFASIGLHLNLGAVTGIPLFLAILIVIAFLTKLIGASVPAAIMGLNRRDSLMVGVAMSGRGAVELIIADIALRAGLFSKPEPVPPVIDHMFSAIVLVAILTTLMVPVGLRLILAYYKPESD